jgi:TonB-dependent SusC/RagA subfamily outer membrane receptor
MKFKIKWIYTLLLALSMQFSFAQEKTVSGVVSDGTGPIPGANVVIKGTKNGVQTDFDGKYSIKAKIGDVLVITFVGMQDATAKVGTSNTINVKLQSGNTLEEVVVVGYGQVKKRNEVTGNVSTISADKIKAAPMVSVDQALQGNIAGLQMATTSGTPGSTQDIRIRGRNSINAGNDPLFVIDGIPMINGNFSGSANVSSLSTLSSIAADNIESMTVLKDAGATSVYGARGANGVILITTKKGKKGDAKFNFSSSVGFQNNAVDLNEINLVSKELTKLVSPG